MTTNASDRREAFRQRLAAGLQRHVRKDWSVGLTLFAVELGRQGDDHVWVLTLQLADGQVLTMHARAHGDPFSDATCDDISRRIVRHLESQEIVRLVFEGKEGTTSK